MEKEEIIINTQLALFFDQIIEKPEELWPPFNSEMSTIFDITPLIMPVPNKTELNDVPIVQMRSSGVYSCNIARGRADLFIAGAGKQKFSDVKDDLLNKAKKYFNFFSAKVKIKRIGFVTRFFIDDVEQDKTITKLLNNKFVALHDGNTHEVFIRYVSRAKINNFDINNFTTLEKFFARIKDVGDNIEGVLLTRDFNTIPEENYKERFDFDALEKFILEGENKFKLEDIKAILWKEMKI